jgi:hypothetical protein
MKRSAIALLVAVLPTLVVGIPAAGAQTLLVDYVGFDYESPNPDTTLFGEVGSGYVGIGFVTQIFAPLTSDTTNNEYTYRISGLTSVNRAVVGPFIIVTYTSPGFLWIWEDSKTLGTPATYGAYPPNGTAPSTFVDGTLYLGAQLQGFQFIYNTSNGTGSYEASYVPFNGTHFSEIPSNQQTGWTFAGATENSLDIPPGYLHQIDGQIFLDPPVPTQRSSWGKIKASYGPGASK